MKRIKGYISSYEITVFLLIFIAMLCDKQNSIPKTLVLSVGLTSIFSIFNAMFKNRIKALIGIFFFTMPFNIVLYRENVKWAMNTAGAKPYLVIDFKDILIVLMAMYIIKNYKKLDWKLFILPMIFIVINLASVFVSVRMWASIYEVIRIFKFSIVAIFFYLSFNKEVYKLMVNGLGCAMIIQLIIGIGQIVLGKALGLQFLGESPRVFRVSVEGLEKGFSGTMAHPGTMALFSLFVLCLVIFTSEDNKLKRVYIGTLIIAISLTFARTSIALMALCLVIGAIFNFRHIFNFKKKRKISIVDSLKQNKKKAIGGLTVLVLIGIVARGPITDFVGRFTESDILHQLKSRTNHITLALDIYKEKPSWAYGSNTYLEGSKRVFPEKFEKKLFNYVHPVHNIYALYLVEIGIVGLLSFISLIGLIVYAAFVKVRNSVKNNKFDYRCRMGLTMMTWMLLFSVYGMTGWSGAKDYFMLIFWMLIGIGIKFIKSRKIQML